MNGQYSGECLTRTAARRSCVYEAVTQPLDPDISTEPLALAGYRLRFGPTPEFPAGTYYVRSDATVTVDPRDTP